VALSVNGKACGWNTENNKVKSSEDRLALESSGILHKTSRKLRGFVPQWYHTTWHSRAYITARLSKRFDRVSYVEIQDGLQDCAAGRKPYEGPAFS